MKKPFILMTALFASGAAGLALEQGRNYGGGQAIIRPAPATSQQVDNSLSPDELFQVTDQFHGVAKPSQIADLPPLVSGIISRIHVSEGDYVHKGDPLVTLDDQVPQARLKAATVEAELTGGLRRAEVQLRMAESRLGRIQSAVTFGAGANFELLTAEGERDQAKAAVEQQQDILKAAEANRELAEAQLNQFTISAPFDGLVTELHIKSGAVDSSQKVVTVANLNRLEVEMHIPSRMFGRIRTGDRIPLKAGIPIQKSIEATVVSVSPVINSASNTFRCLLQIQNGKVQMPAGFSVVLDHAYQDQPRVTLKR